MQGYYNTAIDFKFFSLHTKKEPAGKYFGGLLNTQTLDKTNIFQFWRRLVDPRLLNWRLVPVTFDVPQEVFTSPVSFDSAIVPSKLVSYSWSPN